MATNFSPCKGSYVLNQFPSNVMFGMNGFHVSASGAIQGHHGPLVLLAGEKCFMKTLKKVKLLKMSNFTFFDNVFYAICILKSFSSHISVVVYSFFEFGTVSKWCFTEWVNSVGICQGLERILCGSPMKEKETLGKHR